MPSLVTQIMDVAETRLRQMDSCSGVYRPNRKMDFKIEDSAVILTHGDIESSEDNSAMGNPPKVAWILPLNITCIVQPSMTDEVPIDERMNDFVVEAMDALSEPATSWHTFDNLALNAEFTPPIAIEQANDSARAMNFDCRVTYRVDETAQTTQA